ncbi:MAG: Lrp/AsnC family transcriptional regulator [Clostridia bacterium]|nr:Lrp/AsnC family transcriptional regulator [Clostridia bacterium]
MKKRILALLTENARLNNKELAAALGADECEIAALVGEMESEGIIKGYRTVLDYEKLEEDTVSAIIELKVTPEADYGFEDVAKHISQFSEVESVYLMSGACDIIVVVKGKSFREVATFVAEQLAVMEAVTGTATQFIMRRYKEFFTPLYGEEDDGRAKVSL